VLSVTKLVYIVEGMDFVDKAFLGRFTSRKGDFSEFKHIRFEKKRSQVLQRTFLVHMENIRRRVEEEQLPPSQLPLLHFALALLTLLGEVFLLFYGPSGA